MPVIPPTLRRSASLGNPLANAVSGCEPTIRAIIPEDRNFVAITEQNADALVVLADPFLLPHRGEIVGLPKGIACRPCTATIHAALRISRVSTHTAEPAAPKIASVRYRLTK
jgi:hypothetical protein